MPQDGSNNYQYPPGTPGIPDQTIQSESYNTFLDDLVNNDLNIPRPITRGGTGANNANSALINLTGEKATQLVADYGSQVWLPGSFYSAASATAAPVAGHAFAGICYINEPLVFPPTNANVTVEARDMTDGKVYVRTKTAGVWSVAGWVVDGAGDYVNVTGDTMTGLLTLSGNPTADFHASTKQYVDGGVAGIPGKVSKAGDTMTGLLTLSGDPVNPLHAATKQYAVAKAGDTMTGFLTLSDNPTAILHAATKQYVDGGVAGIPGKVSKAGDTMTGPLVLPADPTAALQAATKQYVDAGATRFQRFALVGVNSVDIAVPAFAVGAIITGTVLPSVSTPTSMALRFGVSSGVFPSGASDYVLSGFYNFANSAAIGNLNNINQSFISLTNAAESNGVYASFRAVINLVRPTTSTTWQCFAQGTAVTASGWATSFFSSLITVAAAGSALRLSALRLLTSPASVWGAESYVNVEWY